MYLTVNLEPHGAGQVVLCTTLRSHLRHSENEQAPGGVQ